VLGTHPVYLHTDVDILPSVGSTAVARKCMIAAAQSTLKKVTLELAAMIRQ
jgi:acyl-CoA reductase-like NAD-dependent aldehyde dehydrogenase